MRSEELSQKKMRKKVVGQLDDEDLKGGQQSVDCLLFQEGFGVVPGFPSESCDDLLHLAGNRLAANRYCADCLLSTTQIANFSYLGRLKSPRHHY